MAAVSSHQIMVAASRKSVVNQKKRLEANAMMLVEPVRQSNGNRRKLLIDDSPFGMHSRRFD
jgi:hypothetical protein